MALVDLVVVLKLLADARVKLDKKPDLTDIVQPPETDMKAEALSMMDPASVSLSLGLNFTDL